MKLVVLALVAACGAKPTPVPTVVMPPPVTPRDPPGPTAIDQRALVPTALASDASHTTVHRLSNGMTVYLSPDPQAPSIVAHITVAAGSSYDPAESTGLAHELEHMLFEGTTRLGTTDYAQEKPHLDRIAALDKQLREPGADPTPIVAQIDAETQRAAPFEIPGEYDRLYQHLGITEHTAFTGPDGTSFVATIPKDRLAQWARVEADRFREPVFRLFWIELAEIYDEKNRALDSPERQTYEAFMRALYPKHGYGQPLLGEIERLEKPAYADMLAFFARYYAPRNMAIELAGDVDASALPILEREFAPLRRAPGAAHEARPIEPLSGRTETTVAVPSGEGVWLGWRLVPATHPDRDALAIMDLMLLDNAHAGLVQRELVQPKKVADASAHPTFLREAGHYLLRADALAGQSVADVEQLLIGVVGKLQRGAFTDEDLRTAIQSAELDAAPALASNEGRVARMERAFVVGEDWSHAVGELDRMRAVTRADIIRVATRYLGGNYIVIKRVISPSTPPRLAMPKIAPVSNAPGRTSAFAKEILAMPPSY